MGNSLHGAGGDPREELAKHAGGESAAAMVEQIFEQHASGTPPKVSFEQFRRYFLEPWYPRMPDRLAEAIARRCDSPAERGSKVSLNGVLRGLLIVRYGSPEDRLNLLFDIYDVGLRNRISPAQLLLFAEFTDSAQEHNYLYHKGGQWRCASCKEVMEIHEERCFRCSKKPTWLDREGFRAWAAENLGSDYISWISEFHATLTRTMPAAEIRRQPPPECEAVEVVTAQEWVQRLLLNAAEAFDRLQRPLTLADIREHLAAIPSQHHEAVFAACDGDHRTALIIAAACLLSGESMLSYACRFCQADETVPGLFQRLTAVHSLHHPTEEERQALKAQAEAVALAVERKGGKAASQVPLSWELVPVQDFCQWVERLGHGYVLGAEELDTDEGRESVCDTVRAFEPEAGDYVCLVPKQWWDAWQQPGSDGSAIDTASLLDVNDEVDSSLTAGRNFVYVPTEVWSRLAARYCSTAGEIMRRVVTVSGTTKVELWPYRIRVVLADGADVQDKPLCGVAGRQVTLRISCAATYRELMLMCFEKLLGGSERDWRAEMHKYVLYDTDPVGDSPWGWKKVEPSVACLGTGLRLWNWHVFVLAKEDSAARPRVTTVPEEISIEVTKFPRLEHYAGVYRRLGGVLHSGYPVWRKADCQHWLYSADSRWQITDRRPAEFQSVEVASESVHNGRLPTEFRKWRYRSYEEVDVVVKRGDAFLRSGSSGVDELMRLGSGLSGEGRSTSLLLQDGNRPCNIGNMGCTCFMDSAMQAFNAVPPLRDYFVNDFHLRDLANSIDEKSDMAGCHVVVELGKLLHEVRSTAKTKLWQLHAALKQEQMTKSFCDFQMHDSAQFWDCLQEVLEREVKFPKMPPLPDLPSSADTESDGRAKWIQAMHQRRSPIGALTAAQKLAVHTCPECDEETKNFQIESSTLVSIPVTSKDKGMKIRIYFQDGRRVTAMVALPARLAKVSHIIEQVCKLDLGIQEEDVIVAAGPPLSKFVPDKAEPATYVMDLPFSDEVAVHVGAGLRDAQKSVIKVTYALRDWSTKKGEYLKAVGLTGCVLPGVRDWKEAVTLCQVRVSASRYGEAITTVLANTVIKALQPPERDGMYVKISEPAVGWVATASDEVGDSLTVPHVATKEDLLKYPDLQTLLDAESLTSAGCDLEESGRVGEAVQKYTAAIQMLQPLSTAPSGTESVQGQIQVLAARTKVMLAAPAVRLLHRRPGEGAFGRARPLFANPGIVTLPRLATGRAVHQMVWDRFRSLTPAPELGYEPDFAGPDVPFSLWHVSADGRVCTKCTWEKGCSGCPLKNDTAAPVVVTPFETLGVEWHGVQVKGQVIEPVDAKCLTWQVHSSVKEVGESHTLVSCLRRTFSDQVCKTCPGCKKQLQMKRSVQLFRLPPVLVLVLSRTDTETLGKLKAKVSYPLKNLDLSGLLAPIEGEVEPCDDPLSRAAVRQPHMYDLHAVVTHQGDSLRTGHYMAYVKHQLPSERGKSRWFECCDLTGVRATNAEAVAELEAFVLFYVRKDLADRDIEEIIARPAGDPEQVDEFEVTGTDVSWKGDRSVMRCVKVAQERTGVAAAAIGHHFASDVTLDVLDISDAQDEYGQIEALSGLAPVPTGDAVFDIGDHVVAARDLTDRFYNRFYRSYSDLDIKAGEAGVIKYKCSSGYKLEWDRLWLKGEHDGGTWLNASELRPETRKSLVDGDGKKVRRLRVDLGRDHLPPGIEQAVENVRPPADRSESLKVRVRTESGGFKWYIVRVHRSTNAVDVSEKKDGTVRKRVVKDGAGHKPKEGDEVKVKLWYVVRGRREPPEGYEERTVCLGDGDLPDVAELVLLTMYGGETAEVKAPQHMAAVASEADSPTAKEKEGYVWLRITLESVKQSDGSQDAAKQVSKGFMWLRKGQLDRAAAAFTGCTTGSTEMRAKALQGLGTVMLKQGLYGSAGKRFADALELIDAGSDEGKELASLREQAEEAGQRQRDYLPRKGWSISTSAPKKNAKYPCQVRERDDGGVMLDFRGRGGTDKVRVEKADWVDKAWVLQVTYSVEKEADGFGFTIDADRTIQTVAAGGPASKVGLRPGLQIAKVHSHGGELVEVSSAARLHELLQEFSAGDLASVTTVVPAEDHWACLACGTLNIPAGHCQNTACKTARSVRTQGECPKGHQLVDQTAKSEQRCSKCLCYIYSTYKLWWCSRCPHTLCTSCNRASATSLEYRGEVEPDMTFVAKDKLTARDANALGQKPILAHKGAVLRAEPSTDTVLFAVLTGTGRLTLSRHLCHKLLEPSLELLKIKPGTGLSGVWPVVMDGREGSLLITKSEDGNRFVVLSDASSDGKSWGPYPLKRCTESAPPTSCVQSSQTAMKEWQPHYFFEVYELQARGYLRHLSRSCIRVAVEGIPDSDQGSTAVTKFDEPPAKEPEPVSLGGKPKTE
eukprot:TRINITY_DN936_c0_g1_i2.p1 TRINITY_DN936_c0_g1~~TRINITY_DN936_c0_g1_i2.p1  ORF type:complete len:2439 (+),score=677.28 TRINITY_DN936_c0_g1_i2:87-7319(+)